MKNLRTTLIYLILFSNCLFCAGQTSIGQAWDKTFANSHLNEWLFIKKSAGYLSDTIHLTEGSSSNSKYCEFSDQSSMIMQNDILLLIDFVDKSASLMKLNLNKKMKPVFVHPKDLKHIRSAIDSFFSMENAFEDSTGHFEYHYNVDQSTGLISEIKIQTKLRDVDDDKLEEIEYIYKLIQHQNNEGIIKSKTQLNSYLVWQNGEWKTLQNLKDYEFQNMLNDN